MKESLNPDTILAPIPAVMVSCGNMQNSNIITIAWTGIINSIPPMAYISIRPTRYSYNIIKKTGEFCINLPDESLVWAADYCGTKSGKEIDKFKTANLTKEQCKYIDSPAIKECPINIECRVKDIKELGSHHMFISEIVGVNCNQDLLENGKIQLAKSNLLTYLGQEYYVANKKVGDRGICLKN